MIYALAAALAGAPPTPAPTPGAPSSWAAPLQVLSIAVPLLVALVGGVFGYRSQARQADKAGDVEGRKLTLAEYEALNRSLAQEIERIRGDRIEDEERFDRRIAALEARLESLERERREHGVAADRVERHLNRRIEQHVHWERMVLRILRTPNVAELIRTERIVIPDPPPGVEDTQPGMEPPRR